MTTPTASTATSLEPHADLVVSRLRRCELAGDQNVAGRSLTMGAQVSPESAEAYTCPPVVPK